MLTRRPGRTLATVAGVLVLATSTSAQLTDITQTPNAIGAGIKKSYEEEIGAGRGNPNIPGSSSYIIQRDPFRAIVRGRQIFQRKFTVAQGLGPRTNDGIGDVVADASHAAGLADSCAACHARPFGSAGFGGNVITRPMSRDAPHLFGLGLQEMLADEITQSLRSIEQSALDLSALLGTPITLPLIAKLISYGTITAHPDGTVDTSGVVGVDPDLRVRPFFAEGSTISIREFLVGAFNAEMGLEAPDTDLARAANGADIRTPSGMLLSGSEDAIEAPPAIHGHADPDADGVVNEIPVSIVDFMEFYLLNYFSPGHGQETPAVAQGRLTFGLIGCAGCHIPNLTIQTDRRVADVRTEYDAELSNGFLNTLHASATPLFSEHDDGSGHPTIKQPLGGSFVVDGIYTDFKRHDLGELFHERNYDGSVTTHFMTEPLWGVASTPPYGHDGRSATLVDVIRRHGGEAAASSQAFEDLPGFAQANLLAFLNSLVLFSPPDTASNLNEVNEDHPDWPFAGHGSIDLSVLFNDPMDKE